MHKKIKALSLAVFWTKMLVLKVSLFLLLLGLIGYGIKSHFYPVRTVPYVFTAEDPRLLSLVDELEAAPAYKHYTIYNSGYGGDIIIMSKLHSALLKSKAKVTMIVTGPVFSANAMITCLPNRKLIVRDNVFFMFHPVQSGGGADMFITKLLGERWMKNNCTYLTKKEVNLVLNGVDVYITGDHVRERLEKMNESK